MRQPNLLPSLLSVVLSLSSAPTFADGKDPSTTDLPADLKGIGITEKLGESISIQSLKFRDEKGEEVALSRYFQAKRPVLLALVYYACPNLCTLVLNGLVESAKQIDWHAGSQYEVVAVSIDHRETPELAAQKKVAYLKDLGQPESAEGWHFLVGQEEQVARLAKEVGFGFKYNPVDGQFAHGAALFVLTPEGKLSRILYGIQYRAQDLRLSLLEASSGTIGTILDRFLLFCYSYNPVTRKYSVVLTRVVQAGSAGTVLVFGSYLAFFWRRQRLMVRRRSKQNVSSE